MTLSEFSIINQYFKSRSSQRGDVSVGIGDDAAVTNVPAGMQLVSAVDTLVNGIHFPEHTPAFAIGHKSLAVNLSDLAAMGAEPVWAMLAMTMPQADEVWITQFCDGFFQLAELHNVQLIGGDTTQGPLTITVQVMGLIPAGKAILRRGARPDDIIFVSGTLGDAAAALYGLEKIKNEDKQNYHNTIEAVINRLNQPTPRVGLGVLLRDIATSAIDVSDGLVADLGHVLEASGVGAALYKERIPVSENVKAIDVSGNSLRWALHGGDDYELCFTAAENNRKKIASIARQLNVIVTEIGVIEQQKKIRLHNKNVCTDLSPLGYEHFSKP